MKKSIKTACLSFFTLLLIFLSALPIFASVPKVDPAEKVYDFAGLFTESERQVLAEASRASSEVTGMDCIILTLTDNLGKSPRNYADQFFERNNLGFGSEYDGVMLYVDMNERDVYILTSGGAIDCFTQRDLDSALDQVGNYLSSQDYYRAAIAFINVTEREILAGSDFESQGMTPLMAVGMSFCIAGIAALILVVAHGRTTPQKPAIHTYFDGKGMHMKRQDDRFLRTHTARVALPKDNGGSGGGGGGGRGAGFHSTSSGRSFGGGGKKF